VVVGSATVKPGASGTIKVSVIMHEGMDGPHLFHIFVKSSDAEKPVSLLKVKADIVPLETWRRSHPQAFYLPPVYALKHKAHEFFYFQSGRKLVWLFPDGSVAKQSVEEVMKHIQRIGM
jgi:hypothetical protein